MQKKYKTNQLPLFDENYPKKVDMLITELQGLMFSYKWVALLTEVSSGRTKAFMGLKEAAVELSKLLAILSPHSGKHRSTTPEQWRKLGVYDPYYAALEPRSPFDLHRIANDYKSRSKVILLRFKPILDKLGEPVQEILTEFYRLNENIVNNLKKDYAAEF